MILILDRRQAVRTTLLGALIAMMTLFPAVASAGSISGIVLDAGTLAPLPGMDIDVFDSQFQLDVEFVVTTGADGRYTISGIEGDVYLRVDATPASGLADQFWPNAFLGSQAQLISVGSNQDLTGIDFGLVDGVSLRGAVLASDTGLPAAGIDLDLIGSDGFFLSGVDAVTALDGTYELGVVPPGSYYVKVDPELFQGYVPLYHPASPTLAAATPVIVSGVGDVSGIDFVVEPGGTILGHVSDALALAGVPNLDLDIFDLGGTELTDFDARTDEVGDYRFGIVPVGTYVVRVDPMPDQPYADLYYSQSATLAGATPITVTKGSLIGAIDFVLTPQGFVTGTVTDAVTGLPLSGIDIDILTPSGVNQPQYDAATSADGSYQIGPMPPGSYLVRADAGAGDPWVDQYHPGVFRQSLAQPVVAGDGIVGGIDFDLPRGGWIRGTVTRASDGGPLAAIDLDMYFADGEAIPSVDADTDALGFYRIGPVPAGPYVLRADPDPASRLRVEYWQDATNLGVATSIQVLTGLDAPGIDFALESAPVTAAPVGFSGRVDVLAPPHPNPFHSQTVLRLRSGLELLESVQVFDVRGRQVRRIAVGAVEPGTELNLSWDGRDSSGQLVSSGIYFMRVGEGRDAPVLKVMRLR